MLFDWLRLCSPWLGLFHNTRLVGDHLRPSPLHVTVVADAVITHNAALVPPVLVNARSGRGGHDRAAATLGALKHAGRGFDALDAAQQLFNRSLLSGWD